MMKDCPIFSVVPLQVLKARDGSIEYLARLDLPQMYPPPGVMACDLKPYQVGWRGDIFIEAAHRRSRL